jgi:hypothetical protein
MINDDEFLAGGGMVVRRNPAVKPLCQPQIPYYLTLMRNLAAGVENQLLTA